MAYFKEKLLETINENGVDNHTYSVDVYEDADYKNKTSNFALTIPDGTTIDDALKDFSSEYSEPVLTYAQKRSSEYPTIEDQLDKIYHNGIDSWKADIKAVKDKYPKGSE
tara:strand:- start:40 stop:369 length:330 start_codon:yes stop_codon:yes gene_type:complete